MTAKPATIVPIHIQNMLRAPRTPDEGLGCDIHLSVPLGHPIRILSPNG